MRRKILVIFAIMAGLLIYSGINTEFNFIGIKSQATQSWTCMHCGYQKFYTSEISSVTYQGTSTTFPNNGYHSTTGTCPGCGTGLQEYCVSDSCSGTCSICGNSSSVTHTSHDFNWASVDSDQHRYTCSTCSYTNLELHTTTLDCCSMGQKCKCGYKDHIECHDHDYLSYYTNQDSFLHRAYCMCGEQSITPLSHISVTICSCNSFIKLTCGLCGRKSTGHSCTSHYMAIGKTYPTSGGSVSGDGVKAVGSAVTVTATPGPQYTFDKWKTFSSSGAEITGLLSSYTSLSANFTMPSDVVTTLAVFNPKTYTISYDQNGGTGLTPSEQTKTYGKALQLRTYRGTKVGYTFAGWSISSSASSATWAGGGTMGVTQTTSDTTLYAVWVLNTYTVNFSANTGTGTMEGQTFTPEVAQNLIANSFTKTGYTFAGWDTNSAGTTVVYADGANYTATDDITLYAVWWADGDVNVYILGPSVTGRLNKVSGVYVITGSGVINDWDSTSVPHYAERSLIKNVIIGDSVTRIGNNTFRNSSVITAYIGDSVTSTGDGAFYSCSSLTNIYGGENVTSIGIYAFYSCTNLIGIEAENSLISIGESAFRNCISLESINIGNSVTSIGDCTFYECSSLINIYGGELVTSIGMYAFYNCSNLTGIDVGNSLTSIGNYAFEGCSSLTSINIGNSITSIAEGVFYDCISLTNIYGGELVTSIGDYAINNCNNLISIDMGNSLTSIGIYAFHNCNSLLSINIENVIIVGAHAFEECSSLTSINMGGSVTSIGDYAFYECGSLINIYGGELVTSIGDYAINNCNNLISIDVGNSLTSIGIYAFDGCSSLESINIGNSITSIVEGVFYDCISLTNIYGGNNVTSIGDYAINNCNSLISIDVGNSVTSIGIYAFHNCNNLLSINIENVIIVGANAFEECSSLTSINMGSSVTSIEEHAFNYCSSLETITFLNRASTAGITFGANWNGYYTWTEGVIGSDYVYAREYTISYTLNGGTVTIPNPTTYTAVSEEITLNNPTMPGYNFNGWTGTEIESMTAIVTIPSGSSGDRAYTANWAEVVYTITYSLNGGTVTPDNPTTYTIGSGEITLNNPIKVGNTFTGWTGSNGETPENVTIPLGSVGNRTYTANWRLANEIIITATAGAHGTISPSGLTTILNGANKTFIIVADTGYTIDTLKIDGEDVNVTGCYVFSNVLSDRTIEVTFKEETGEILENYGLKKNCDGLSIITSTVGGEMVSIQYIPKAEIYFAGWVVNYGGISIADPMAEIITFTMPSKHVEITAKVLHQFTVTFNANGGTGTMNDQIFEEEEAENLTPNSFTKPGYIFTGWNWSADGTGTSYANEASYTAQLNTTLYAQWTEQ